MNNDIIYKVRRIIKENIDLVVDINEIQGDEKFEDFGVNSISFIKLVVATESEFGFEFDDDDLDFIRINTINNLVEYIKNRISV